MWKVYNGSPMGYYITQGLNMIKFVKWIVALLLLPVLVFVEFYRAIQSAGIEFGNPDDVIGEINKDLTKNKKAKKKKAKKKAAKQQDIVEVVE